MYQPNIANADAAAESLARALGLTVTYAHEEYYFLRHNTFLLEWRCDGFDVHLNRLIDRHERDGLWARIQAEAGRLEMTVARRGIYALHQSDDEEMRLEFYDGL